MIGVKLRTERTHSEQRERIQSIEDVLDLIGRNKSEDAWLLTFEPCLAQVYAPQWLRIADLAIIDKVDPRKLAHAFESHPVYALLRPWDTNASSQERMSAQLEWLQSHEWTAILESPTGRLLQRAQPNP